MEKQEGFTNCSSDIHLLLLLTVLFVYCLLLLVFTAYFLLGLKNGLRKHCPILASVLLPGLVWSIFSTLQPNPLV